MSDGAEHEEQRAGKVWTSSGMKLGSSFCGSSSAGFSSSSGWARPKLFHIISKMSLNEM